jgi:hypothetical protein
VFDALKAAMAKFTAEFWRGFDAARAKAITKAQPAPLDHPFFASAEFRNAIATIITAAFADGAASERKRVCEVLNAPGAALFPTIAIDLAQGDATAAQAACVLARAETDAATRATLLKSSPLESANAPTIH